MILSNLFRSKTLRDTFLIFSGNSMAMVVGFIYTVILVRVLSTEDFGYYSAVFSLMLLSADISELGIGSSLSRFLPEYSRDTARQDSFLKSAFLVQGAVALLISGLFIAGAPFISGVLFQTQSKANLLFFASFGVVGLILYNFFMFSLTARQKFFFASLLSFGGSLLRLGFLLALVAFSMAFLMESVIAQSASMLAAAFFGFLLIRPKFLSRKKTQGDTKRLLSFSLFLGIARGLTALSSRLDAVMLIALAGAFETGVYSTASRVASLYPLLSGSFSTVIAPRLAKIKTGEELKTYIIKVSLLTSGIIASIIFLIIFSRQFMELLFADKGTESWEVFRLLLVAMIFFVASVPPVSIAVYYIRKPFILTVNSVMQVLIVFAGNIIFIPLFKRNGPAVSLIIAYLASLLLTTIMTFYYLQKRKESEK